LVFPGGVFFKGEAFPERFLDGEEYVWKFWGEVFKNRVGIYSHRGFGKNLGKFSLKEGLSF